MSRSFEQFELLPEEVRKKILLRESIGSSRLLSVTNRDILIDDFIDNPIAPSKDELSDYMDITSLPFVVIYKRTFTRGGDVIDLIKSMERKIHG